MHSKGGIPPSKYMRLVFNLLRLAINYPLAVGERLFARSIQRVDIQKDPIFIIGHFRSGTSLMYKLLSADPRWRCIREYELVFPYQSHVLKKVLKPMVQKLINYVGVKHPNFNNYAVDLDDPNEDEALLVSMGASWSAYWSYIFPLHESSAFAETIPMTSPSARAAWKSRYHYFLKRLLWKEGGHLLIKSPLSTARVDVLLELFPNARFIHLTRNPVDVQKSMSRIWKTEILRFFCLQVPSPQTIEKQVADTHHLLTSQFQDQRNLIRPGNLAEISYDQLITNPTAVISGIYEQFNLPLDAAIMGLISKKISAQTGYQATSYSEHHAESSLLYSAN
jgi:hypothetical protein